MTCRLLPLALLLLALPAVAATVSWTLDDPGDYTFDPAVAVIADSEARLLPDLGGTGTDGDLSLSGQTWDLSVDASGGRSAADGVAWPVTDALSAGATGFTLQGYAGGLATGDELLLLAAQGSSTATAQVGGWELTRVLQVDPAGAVTVAPLAVDLDGSSYAVFAQRVPNYGDVVLAGSVLTGGAWDGSTGGVVAFRAAGDLTVDAGSSITATGLGFRGGAAGGDTGTGGGGGESWAGIDGDGGDDGVGGGGGGGAGEGPSSFVGNLAGDGGYGAGGGGADGTDNDDDGAGGGGGGSYGGGGGGGGGGTGCGATDAGRGGAGGDTGIEAGGGGASSCAGGQGGDAGQPGTLGNGSCYWSPNAQPGNAGAAPLGGGGGDCCGGAYGGGGGGGGGLYGAADLSTLFFGGGGGGGGGSTYGFAGGAGGAGGGAALVFADEASVDGAIVADGLAGGPGGVGHRVGDGGSGAGGSVWLSADELSITGALSAVGAAAVFSQLDVAGGGGGGVGRIRVDAAEVNGVDASDGGFEAEVTAWTSPAPGHVAALSTGFATEAQVCAASFVAPVGPVVWSGFTSVEDPDGGAITFTLTPDGVDQHWWDGVAWSVSGGIAQSNPAATVHANLPTWPHADLSWCAWLDGDGSQEVTLLDVDVVYEPDADGDGDPDVTDCDDGDPTIWTGAPETCDLIDSDCDGDLVDGEPDLDGDGTPDCIDEDIDGDGDANATD